MDKIKLSQGKFALVDDSDFNWLNQWKWCAVKLRNTFYAQRTVYGDEGKRVTVHMHRVILGLIDRDIHTDHKNNNGLDNQRQNLRPSTRSENLCNMVTRRGLSKFKGVSWRKRDRIWQAKVTFQGKCFGLGVFKNEADAARAYNKKAKDLFGVFAKLNIVNDEIT